VEYGMNALALTDTDGLYGVIPFYKAAREAGVRPILGAQLGRCTVLARDREGYAQLCALATALHLGQSERERPAKWPENGLDLSRLFVMSGDVPTLEALHRAGVSVLAAVEHYGGAASHRRAETMVARAQRMGIPPVAVAPVHFLDPAHWAAHRVLSAIRGNTTVDALGPEDTAPPEAWFRSPRDMERLFAAWPETLDNALWVAEECGVELTLGKPLFPDMPLPEGESAFSWLWKQTFEGLQRCYQPLSPTVLDRVHNELGVIHDLGFAPYFLIVADIVRFAKEHDIPVVGRGSAGNSVVAYALGITRVDPFKYGLYFERFLNRSRSDCPDIDLDLCWRRRDEVIDYVYRTYGANHVAMIATTNTFGARSAVREVAKATGVTGREIALITRVLPHYGAGDIRTLAERVPECRGIRLDEEPLKSILATCEFIDGFPRHLSIHAGGLVIAPEPLTRFVPLQRAAKGIVITQYDMHPVEDLGLVKMDLLGHRSLSVIYDTVASIRENRGVAVDVECLPDPDPLTAELLRTGNTVGCFQIESPAMRGLLRKMGADDTRTLVQAIALVRPGASGSGMKQHFIDRHHGREAVEYLHPALEAVLGDTYGVMIYQEDVLKVAHAVAGMDLAEADALRRAMSKKRGPREMARHMKGFVEKAMAKGVPDDTARQIWELIANFASYAYCKAHAATYGELAYQCAWLKAHFPAEFFAAVLANQGGFYMPAVYLEEARHCGVQTLATDINKSKCAHSVESDGIRVGLCSVKGLSMTAIQAVLEARENESFSSLAEVLHHTQLHRDDALALCHAGAFDALSDGAKDRTGQAGRLRYGAFSTLGDDEGNPISRAAQLWQLDRIYENKHNKSETSAIPSVCLVAGAAPTLPGPSARQRCNDQWEWLDMLLDTHPLRYVLSQLSECVLTPSHRLADHAGRRVTMTGWPITERRLNTRDGGGYMKFLTLQDVWGVYEAVLFPEAYQSQGHYFAHTGPCILKGEAQLDHGHPVLMVDTVQPLYFDAPTARASAP
jgi:DNA-directed DNA polymerase III PolC